MNWIEVKIYTNRNAIEPVCAVILNAGINGMQIDDSYELSEYLKESSPYWDYVDEELLNRPKEETKITIYVSDNPYGQELLLNLTDGIKNLKSMQNEFDFYLGSLKIETEESLDEEVWLNKWKEFYKPFNIGNKVLVKPFWENIENTDRIVFNINPGHVFGTGLHQTTQLCVEQLEKYVNKNSNVLDLGCGSGILSIISLLLGAKYAFALDIDKNAVKTSYENAELNHINKEKYYVTYGNIIDDENLKTQIKDKYYDVIVANIVADVICLICPIVREKIHKNGVFISSGIIKDRIQDVYKSLDESGFQVIDTIFKDEWVCVVSKVKF